MVPGPSGIGLLHRYEFEMQSEPDILQLLEKLVAFVGQRPNRHFTRLHRRLFGTNPTCTHLPLAPLLHCVCTTFDPAAVSKSISDINLTGLLFRGDKCG